MQTPTTRGGSKTVLVVDDDEGARLVIARMLGEAGFTVRTAMSGADGLAQLVADASISTVVTDVSMPDMTGVEVAYHIREHHPNVAVAIVSGDISDIERSVVARAGVPFLKKPVRLDALLGAIRDARRRVDQEHSTTI